MNSLKNILIFFILFSLLSPVLARSGNPKLSLFSTKDKKSPWCLRRKTLTITPRILLT